MKPLKILLGNNTLSLLAGSETWTLTLALALKELGHNVSCFAPQLGIISDKLITAGIPCYSDLSVSGVKPFSFVLEEKIDHDYDVIISNHNHIVEYLRTQFPKKPIISTIHGIIHFSDDGKGNQVIAPEHPALNSGIAQFVSVSEEIQEKLKADYNIESSIIRNFFDIKKFDVKPASEGKPKQFLVNTNYMDREDPAIQVIRDVAKHFGARVTAVGMNFTQSQDITKALEDSDVVFGMGRSVLEGVAAGRLGIVHGRWGTGGVICESNIEGVRHHNFSGRNSEGKLATAEEIISMIEQYYTPENLSWGKKYIAREHNATFAAEEYVRLSRELTGEMMFKPAEIVDTRRPFRLQKDVERTS
jgi:hypothetical protein